MEPPSPKREPSFSPTSPASKRLILQRLEERAPEFTGYQLRVPISENEESDIIDLLNPTTKSGRPAPVPNFRCYSLVPTTRWPGFQVLTLYKSARDILGDPTILPYELSASDINHLRSRVTFKGQRFTLEQRDHLLEKLAVLAGELSALRNTEYRGTRGAPLFNLFPGRYVDALGRHFIRDKQSFVFKYFNLNFGRGTSEFTRKGLTISLPIYAWNGLAGLSVDAKAAILENKGTDFHHVDENLWDIRPNSVMPIPSFVHRWAHSNSYTLAEYKRFFV